MSFVNHDDASYTDVLENDFSDGGVVRLSPDLNAIPTIITGAYSEKQTLLGKRVFDFFFSLTMLVFFAPLLLLIFLVIRSDGGHAVFKHRRVGKNGVEFDCYKFRSMVLNAEDMIDEIIENDPVRKQEWLSERKFTDDPRVTKIGDFLRRKSFDELPQLINVLRGEMSMIGPRPIVREETLKYGNNFKDYASVKPGLTGLWQVSGRNDISYEERVALDVDYVTNLSWRRELGILIKTVVVVMTGRGAR
ncbi:MAG: sugar transferase [Pseudomonadota bacterium]